jgi:hypothetical protein
MRGWVCLLWIYLAFRQVYVSHIQHVIENSSFYTTHKSSVSPGFVEQIMPILRILCYNGSLITWTVVSLTAAKFKPLIFSMSGFALFYTANMFILMISYYFCLLPAQFKVEVVLRLTVSQPVYLGVKPPSGAQDQICITVRLLRVCWCGAPSPTRRRVCRLQLLLALASAVILGSEFRGTHDHVSDSRPLQPGEPGVCIYIPQGQVGPVIPPSTGFRFLRLYYSQGYGGGIRTRLHARSLRYLSSSPSLSSFSLLPSTYSPLFSSSFFYHLLCFLFFSSFIFLPWSFLFSWHA